MTLRRLLLGWLALTCASPARGAIASADEAWQHVAFGFVNDAGAFSLDGDTRGPLYDPHDMAAFVHNGEVHRTEFKEGAPGSNGTLSVSGARNVNGVVVPGIITEKHRLIPLRRQASPGCTTKLRSKLKALTNREVVRCQATHELGQEGLAGYAVFETIGTGLAAFFIATPSTLSIERHETAPGQGWRDGDGGNFSSDDLNLLWSFQRKKDGAFGVAYTWGVGQGTHTAIVLARGDKLARVFDHYGYDTAGGLQ